MARLISLSLILFLFACQSEEEEVLYKPCHRDWEEIQDEKVINVLAENSPASFFIYRGRNMGYEYELLHQFAKDMNVRLKVTMANDLDEMYNDLRACKADIVAAHLTVTESRDKLVDFSTPHLTTHHVLVQRIPSDTDTVHQLITEIEHLRGKTVHVWRNSSFYENILRINDGLNLNMNIIATTGGLITEELMKQVSEGKIDYTIADQSVAQIDLNYYDNLDISLKLSPENEIAFALRQGSGKLLDTLNYWLNDPSNRSTIGEVNRKYFDRRNLTQKAQQQYSSLAEEGQLSPYDDIIKKESAEIGWDWRLISAIIYQESKFETWKVSWAGAFGIFQFMPATAEQYGISPSSPADAQIRAGIRKLDKNYKQWLELVPDSSEAIKFTLANYNAGHAHIYDARALCEKYDGCNPDIWSGHVDEMLLNLSKPKYYQDEVVQYGYCRGIETYEYVIEVMQRFEEYKAAFPDEK